MDILSCSDIQYYESFRDNKSYLSHFPPIFDLLIHIFQKPSRGEGDTTPSASLKTSNCSSDTNKLMLQLKPWLWVPLSKSI